ncbi:MAG: hypothetical protein HRT57_16635 [Crocinitomicaceae bacterium]|nr:hypothetical protein [Crocinitomicaceae bacterium]
MKFAHLYTLLLTLALVFPIVYTSYNVLSGSNDQFELSENSDEEESSDETDNEEEEQESKDKLKELIAHDLTDLAELDTKSTNTFVHQQSLYSISRELSTPPPRIS